MQNDPLVAQMQQTLASQGYKPPAPSGASAASVPAWQSQISSKFDTSPKQTKFSGNILADTPEAAQAREGTSLRSAMSKSSAVTNLNALGDEMGKNMSGEEMAGVNQAKDAIVGGGKTIAEGANQAFNAKTIGEAAQGGIKEIGGALDSAAQSAIGAGRAIFAPFTAAIKTFINHASDVPAVQQLAQTPAIKSWLDSADESSASIEQLAKEHPTFARVVENIMGVGSLALGGGAEGSIEPSVVDSLKGAFSEGSSALKSVAGVVKEGVGPQVPTSEVGATVPKAGVNTTNGVVNKVQNALNPKNPFGTGKTLEEVLATPEKDVGKLSSSERAAYYKNQADTVSTAHDAELKKINQAHESSIKDIKQKADVAQAKIDSELQAKSDASIKETQALKTQIDKTSVEEAASLKKPAVEVYKKNSEQFGKLFDEEFTADKQKIPLKQADLIAKLDNEFANEPDMNPKGRLGLDDKGKDITAKEFYDRVKGLKMSSSGSKGTSTFTAGDLAINRTRGILTDTLKENGVDLSKANKFWSEWKPLQREINSKVKPFDPGYKTGTMANVLKASASEVGDAKNAKFISDFESQLGRPLPKGTKAAMEKLSAAQKQIIADKVTAQEAKDAAITEKESAIESQKAKTGAAKDKLSAQKEASQKDIYDRQFSSQQEADRISKNRKILLWALGAAGVGTGAIKLGL